MVRKKILLDLRLADQFTGIGLVTSKFKEFLLEGDYKVNFIYTKAAATNELRADSDNLELDSLYAITSHLKLHAHLKRTSPDYLIFPHYFVGLFIPHNVKVISFVHDIMAISDWRTFWSEFGFIKTKILKTYLKKCLQKAIILVPSYTVKKEIKQIFRFESRVTPNGFTENSGVHNAKTEKEGFIYIGNNRKHKNLNFILDIFKRRDEVLKIVSKDEVPVQEKIHTYHKVDKNHLIALLEESKALVVPSKSEGFCLPIIEAAKLDVKVLANKIPVFKEFYGLDITYFTTVGECELDFILENFDELSSDRRFTEHFDSAELFDWSELRYFLLNLT